MLTSHPPYSVGSYIQSMQVMVESSQNFELSRMNLPNIDNELLEADDCSNGKLTISGQDRNEWDDIFDEFNDLSCDKLNKLCLQSENFYNPNDIFKELFKLVDNSQLVLSRDIFFEHIMSIIKTDSSLGLEQELFNYLGAENIELISFLLKNRSFLENVPLTALHSIDEIEADHVKFLTEKDIRNQVLQNVENSKRQILLPSQKQTKYPYVFRKSEASYSSTLSFSGQKFVLPIGTVRTSYQTHEEIIIPCANHTESLIKSPTIVKISKLDLYCRSVFEYKEFNKIQSLAYPIVYNTNENMLICAPTGAGKTDIALLSILNVIKQFSTINDDGGIEIQYNDFKIIYVAPLKALAAEIVAKFSKKLSNFKVQVKELTGDIQLTKSDIISTQVIVTTPEKWDVVTRKPNSDNDILSKVKLLIIDEVHLLHEDRGSVIETIVARTLRQVESSQSMIRILGLSATLPNFMDVADFLGVNRRIGMFYFDQSFRPKPLEQYLIGCRGKSGSKQAKDNIDKVSYDKLVNAVQNKNRVMVFVHSRKDTIRSAKTFISIARSNNELELFAVENVNINKYSRDMTKHKDKDMKEIFQFGFGVHHAGMSRSDRNLTEQMFKDGAINVLICTATLAWGVNLPADVVIIKGTQVYDSKKGGFTDLGISDIIQIFGRAGRPGFGASYGTGILCTTNDRLDHYVSLITQQHPIESKLGSKLVDNLNAEISLGTVTNVEEGIQWLGYTYLFVRMRQNPFVYGIDWEELSNDPQLYERRKMMIIKAASRLHTLQMIIFNENLMNFIPKDLGRVSSDFYLLNESVEIFNQMCNPRATEADVLSMISMSSEFDSIKFREEEANELSRLMENSTKFQINAEIETSQGKSNILLQTYISQSRINDSSLLSDSNYISQNSIRLCRALLLIGINRRWGNFSQVMLNICKSIERRMWSFCHPLCQFDLPETIIRQICEKNPPIEQMLDMKSSELGELVHNNKMGTKLYSILRNFPRIDINAEIFPITVNIMRIHVDLYPKFHWDVRIHGDAQFFWVLVEESNNSQILHVEKFILNKRQLGNPHELDFMIPLSNSLPPQVIIKVISDTWIGSGTTHAISFQHLIRPHNETLQTSLKRLRPLPIVALKNPLIESIYPFKYFNPIQTMVFHTLYNTNNNVFIGSPTGSGKTIAAELAIWNAFKTFPGKKVVYIAPMKALVRERVDDWRRRITSITGDRVVELTGDSVPDPKDIKNATIIVTTPEKFDGISRNWKTRKFIQNISLIIMDEIHLLASNRGPILEMIVSRMNYMSYQTQTSIRLLGMSTAVSNAYDMAGWLNVKNNGLYNFPSSVRPVPLKMYIDGFPDNLAFSPLMKSMNKPVFMAIKQHSLDKPVLIFVASRRQTRLTALDLIHLCGVEDNPRRFVIIDDLELQYYLSQVTDETLKLSLQFGIGLHHAGLVENDRAISHELFQKNKIQILIATSTLAWGVNLPAHLVIIKGTQFFDAKIEGYKDMDLTDILQMMGRAGRPGFDTSGTAIIYTKESKKMFYKHFLNVGFPVESSLHEILDDHIGAEISSGAIKNKQDAMNFLRWTFFFRRAYHNPTYYGIEDTSVDGVNEHLSKLIDSTLNNLSKSQSVVIRGNNIIGTPFLSISSYYYISHRTIHQLLKQIYNRATFLDVIKWLSLAIEYNELPVRHGEVIINTEMSSQSRYSVETSFTGESILPMWDPHIKAFLLLQAHLSRVDLPIADYNQDTISVLDQSLRILQAYIDVASELGYFHTVLTMIKLMQCIKQGYWYEDNPITALPGCQLKRIKDIEYSEQGWPVKMKERLTLDKLGRMDQKKLISISQAQHIDRDIKHKYISEVSKLPILDEIKFERQMNPNKLVILAKHHNKTNNQFKVWCDKFPKVQKELWFFIAYQDDELLLIKRCQPKKQDKREIIRCEFMIPEELYGHDLNFVVINDAMDLKYELRQKLMNPT